MKQIGKAFVLCPMKKIDVDFSLGNMVKIVLKNKVFDGLAVRAAEFEHDEPNWIGCETALGTAGPFVAEGPAVNPEFRITTKGTIRCFGLSVVEGELDPKRSEFMTFELLAKQSGNGVKPEAASEEDS